jgi:Cullin binding
VSGFCDLGVDSIDKLKQKLPQLEIDLNDIHKFKDFYQYTFNYAKETGQKGLDLDMAIAYWNIVLKDRFKFLDLWCKFLTVSCNYFFDEKYVIYNIMFNRKIIKDLYRKIHGICY